MVIVYCSKWTDKPLICINLISVIVLLIFTCPASRSNIVFESGRDSSLCRQNRCNWQQKSLFSAFYRPCLFGRSYFLSFWTSFWGFWNERLEVELNKNQRKRETQLLLGDAAFTDISKSSFLRRRHPRCFLVHPKSLGIVLSLFHLFCNYYVALYQK